MTPTLLLATRNHHKVEEIQAILGPGVVCRSLAEFPDAPELIEDQDTFAENAVTKAAQLAGWLKAHSGVDSGLVVADDSGLEVDALGGAPGVRSARFAANPTGSSGNASDEANNTKLLSLLRGVPPCERQARFRCVLALVDLGDTQDAQGQDSKIKIFEGRCEGAIAEQPSGGKGFGYDPLFIPCGSQLSFADLDSEEKNRISHRRRALEGLAEWLGKGYGE